MVFRDKVRTAEEALVYLTDCTLATVASMAMRKSRAKHEYSRQISMGQFGVDQIRDMSFDEEMVRGSRPDTILNEFGGSVQAWADSYDVLLETE